MSLGALVVAASAVAAAAFAFPLRRGLPAPIVALGLGAAGVALAAGGMTLRPNPSTGEIVLAVALMAVLLPAHVRIVLGPFGRR